MGRPRIVDKLVAEAERRHKPLKLSTSLPHDLTRGAQEYLDAAVETVNRVLATMVLARTVDKAQEATDHRGRLGGPQVDILRASLVFAGAGVDAVLKRLIQDTIRPICSCNEQAREKFSEFIVSYLQGQGTPVNLSNLAAVLISEGGSAAALINAYERKLTGNSLQSVDEVDAVCGALGISNSELRKRTSPKAKDSLLRRAFVARNQIIHELDLTGDPRHPRTHRGLEDVRKLCRESLEVTQLIVNSVVPTLRDYDASIARNVAALMPGDYVTVATEKRE